MSGTSGPAGPAEPAEPAGPGPEKRDRGGFLPIGLAVGLAFLYLVGIVYIAPRAIPRQNSIAPLTENVLLWAPLVLYAVVAVVLTLVRRTSMTGAGLLIALGVWLLLGGELCISAMVA
ncbi:hypothetical protein [Sinomonas sp. R1AF57]|uniref:hypothetical protein n=1 Tax=Sinomonas sp. R1AF57 TaxID=2020377 RepID=UPI000B5E4AB7|nr:hypothetical protein [Sinomonas sp. R1AF57]ASN53061.1 hypothetical protein CGQ25_13940 [Sinomonas sp. R1AF57]